MAVNWRLNYCASTNLRQLMANGCKLVTGLLCIYQSRVLWVGAKLRLVSKKKKMLPEWTVPIWYNYVHTTRLSLATAGGQGRSGVSLLKSPANYCTQTIQSNHWIQTIRNIINPNIAHKQNGTLSIQHCSQTMWNIINPTLYLHEHCNH